MGKDIGDIKSTTSICCRGATPESLLAYVQENRGLFPQKKIILIHVGTNYLGSKYEWLLYQNFRNGKLSHAAYENQLRALNPLPASGTALSFQRTFEQIITEIRKENKFAKIIISGIIPRVWDYDRQQLVLESYNNILRKFNSCNFVYFIPTHKPFLTNTASVKQDLFQKDGLHLANSGSRVLRSFICDKLDKARKDALK